MKIKEKQFKALSGSRPQRLETARFYSERPRPNVKRAMEEIASFRGEMGTVPDDVARAAASGEFGWAMRSWMVSGGSVLSPRLS